MLGRRLARPSRRAASRAAIGAIALVVLAAIPRFQPAWLHLLIPLEISIWIEGVLAAPCWMLLVGALWAGQLSPRLKRAAPLMAILGLVYYAFGGIWMVLPNIDPPHPERVTTAGVTLQSRIDTCVPSASATAVRLMGYPTSEAIMCRVTQAKPSRGSTLARAAWGLRRYLAPRGIRTELSDLSAREVVARAGERTPVLVTIRSNLAADHMVVVVGGDSIGVTLLNPSPGVHGGVVPAFSDATRGVEIYRFDDFEDLYRGAAIVFEPIAARGSERD